MSLMLGPNRLVNEKSPYLLQHAYNPVDWYPWGEEAFNVAAAENKPIFLKMIQEKWLDFYLYYIT